MKRSLVLFALLFSTIQIIAQGNFAAGDISGRWRGTKSGKELLLDINGNQAIIASVEGTSLPKQLVGGRMYEGIQYQGQGKWTAQRNGWKFSRDPEKGSWELENRLTLSLSADKNTLSASGHWTFKRENSSRLEEPVAINDAPSPLKTRPPVTATTKETVTRDFGGVAGTLMRVTKPSGRDFILAKFSNRTADKRARLLIKIAGGNLVSEVLEPGAVSARTYEGRDLEVQVLYEDYTAPVEPYKPIDFIKEKVRHRIINTNGKIKVENIGSIGVRG